MNDNEILLAIISKVRGNVTRLIKAKNFKYLIADNFFACDVNGIKGPSWVREYKKNVANDKGLTDLEYVGFGFRLKRPIRFNCNVYCNLNIILNRHLQLQLYSTFHNYNSHSSTNIQMRDEITGNCVCPHCRPINLDLTSPESLKDFPHKFYIIGRHIEECFGKMFELERLDEEFFLNFVLNK